jgi:hypothetical protein
MCDFCSQRADYISLDDVLLCKQCYDKGDFYECLVCQQFAFDVALMCSRCNDTHCITCVWPCCVLEK